VPPELDLFIGGNEAKSRPLVEKKHTTAKGVQLLSLGQERDCGASVI
jgi:hypothetical protein